MILIFSGLCYKEGKIWFEEFYDKLEFVVIYFYWVIKYCEGDGNMLRVLFDNIVEYYKNNYKWCDLFFRCRVDLNYEFLCVVIENFVVEKLLRGVIVNFIIYKYFDDFKFGWDIYFVESFNNILNIY